MKKFELQNLEEGQVITLTSQDAEYSIHEKMTDAEAEEILEAYPTASHYIKAKAENERS